MGRFVGIHRIVAGVLVVGAATAGIAVGAGSMAAGQVRPEPNCTVPGDGRVIMPEAEPVIDPPSREQSCATLEVTKVVNRTAPEGTIFRVVVQCQPIERRMLPPELRGAELPQGQFPPFSTVLEFPATGGTQKLFLASPSSCTLSETPPPGCTLASIQPSTVEMTQPNVFQVLVTNDCEPPAAPVSIQGTIVVNQPPPAPVVVTTPRFTG